MLWSYLKRLLFGRCPFEWSCRWPVHFCKITLVKGDHVLPRHLISLLQNSRHNTVSRISNEHEPFSELPAITIQYQRDILRNLENFGPSGVVTLATGRSSSRAFGKQHQQQDGEKSFTAWFRIYIILYCIIVQHIAVWHNMLPLNPAFKKNKHFPCFQAMISVAGLDLPAAWHSLQNSATAVGYLFSTWLYCLIINVCMALFWNWEVLHLTASHVSFIPKKVLESLCEKAARQSKLGDVCHRPVSFIFFIIILVHPSYSHHWYHWVFFLVCSRGKLATSESARLCARSVASGRFVWRHTRAKLLWQVANHLFPKGYTCSGDKSAVELLKGHFVSSSSNSAFLKYSAWVIYQRYSKWWMWEPLILISKGLGG